jgi:hypothetical protein
MPRKDDSGYNVDVRVDPGYQVDDGRSQIKATATVTYNNQPVRMTRIDWQILPGNISAIFTKSGQTTWAGVTDNNGQCVAAITDTKPGGGQVIAYITLNNGDTPSGQDAFHFVPAVPDAITLELQNDGVYAGSGDYITAVATPMWNGKPYLAAATIDFQLITSPTSRTQLYDGNGPNAKGLGKTATVSTDPSTGQATTYIKGPMWETATCDAWWTLDNPPYAGQAYTINPPPMNVALNPLTTFADDGKNTVCECSQAPAVHYIDASLPSGFTATATIIDTLDNPPQPWTNGGSAIVTLPSPGPTVIIPDGSGITVGDQVGQYRVPIDTTTGKVSLSFWADTYQQGSVSVYVPGLDGKPSGNTAIASYAFSNAWHGISSATIDYDAGYHSAWIYANGTQQAKVIVNLTLVDKYGQPLTSDQMPTQDVVYGATTLLSYDTVQALGTGSLSMWTCGRTANEYSKETPTGTFRRAQPRADDDDGTVTLTYYVSCNQATSDLTFGLWIKPTGGAVILTGNTDQTTHLPTATYVNGCPAKIYASGHTQLDQQTRLSTRVPPIYTLDLLDVVANPNPHADENDHGPAGSVNAADKEGNYWRQWDYTITISTNPQKNRYGGFLFKCVLAGDSDYDQLTSNSYCFAETANPTFYTYKAYLWPVNIDDAEGNPLPLGGGTATMNAVGAQDQTYTFPPAGGTPLFLNVTLYMSFAGRPTTVDNDNPVNVMFYDNFGTRAHYRFDGTSLPQSYDLSINSGKNPPSIPDWKPLTYVAGSFVASAPQKRTAGPPVLQTWEGEHYWNLGTITLSNVNADSPMTCGPRGWMDFIDNSWREGLLGYMGPSASTNVLASAEPTEGDYRYASTALLYLCNVSEAWYYMATVQGITDVKNLICMTDNRKYDEVSRCQFTPLWYNQTAAVYFVGQSYLYYPGYETTPFPAAGPNYYNYLLPFIPDSDLFQWRLAIVPS